MSMIGNYRTHRFYAEGESKVGLDPALVRSLIETGWKATVESTDEGTRVILTQTTTHRDEVPVTQENARAAAVWAGEFNRRSQELHTGS